MAVKVGNIYIGDDYPVVIQSMTSTDTNDIEASVAQCIRIIEAGGQMVRLTTQGLREVESLARIRDELSKRGYSQPLVADVHFLPKVALAAARVADKVRINPGNYVDRQYDGPPAFDAAEQERQMVGIRTRLLPLIKACIEHDTAIRVGVNHGSLSKRILSWYGDTPEGMVESAMEFLRIFAGEDFHRIVVSLKASDSRIMVYANRLLVRRMREENLVYPLHLGVTEAGADEDGVIKSSAGISTLLSEGIGDTIRVSLTEDPEHEIPVGARIVKYFGQKTGRVPGPFPGWDPFHYQRHPSVPAGNIGGNQVPVVMAGHGTPLALPSRLRECGYIEKPGRTLEITGKAADYVFIGHWSPVNPLPPGIPFITENGQADGETVYAMVPPHAFSREIGSQKTLTFIRTGVTNGPDPYLPETGSRPGEILVLDLPEENAVVAGMAFFAALSAAGDKRPVILHRHYRSPDRLSLMVRAAGELGALLTNGFGDGIWISAENTGVGVAGSREIAFSILQATKTRISETEYISCPSCGRTLFNIQDTLRRIKEATLGMKGVKIAVMGCIVNGPGEMADADYGYVGAGRGKVTLYKGREPVKKNIPEEQAVDELIRLIEGNDR